MPSPTTRRLLLTALAAGMLASLAPVSATAGTAHVLEIRRITEHYQTGENLLDGRLVHRGEETGRIYLAADRARYDQGDGHSWILLEDERRLLLLRHDEATYQELRLPVRLEDHLNEEQREAVAEMERRAAPAVTVTATAEEREIDGRRARKTLLAGAAAEGVAIYDHEVWLADLPVDTRLYGELTRSFGALHLIFRGTAERLAQLDGFPVLRRSVVTKSASYEVDTRTLESIETREVPDAVFAPPAGYSEVPFAVEEWLQLE